MKENMRLKDEIDRLEEPKMHSDIEALEKKADGYRILLEKFYSHGREKAAIDLSIKLYRLYQRIDSLKKK